MTRTKGISPKLAGAIGPPLTAVATAMILTNTVDRTSLAALASIAIGAALGYHAPAGKAATPTATDAPGGFFTTASASSTSGGYANAATGDDDDDDTRAIPDNPDAA
jgi:hypothetical protein